jgi:uncharacterized protein (DUF305 family)
MRTRNRTIAAIGLLAAALVLTACGNSDDPTVGSPTTDSRAAAEQAQFNDQDKDFAGAMAVHHSQAVEMADLILEKNPSEPVRALAERIKAAQQPEIDQMHGMLETFGEDVSGGGHGGHADSTGMAGMMTDEQMQQLEDASGVEAERAFLQLMIEHHRGAIEMSEMQIADGEHGPAIELAKKVRADQTAEIAEIEQLLTQL